MKTIRYWWKQLFVIPLWMFVRSAPSMADDPHERAWRMEYFEEARRANWRIIRQQWSMLFDWRRSKKDLQEKKIRRQFTFLHHPMSGSRQMVEWRQRGPHNPPPSVRKTLEVMRTL